jgi:hypothetical protein
MEREPPGLLAVGAFEDKQTAATGWWSERPRLVGNRLVGE